MNNEIIQTWNTTLYLRLSREDGDKEESNSITGQRELLRDYLKAHPELHEYRWQDEFEWQLDILSRAAKEAV